MAALWLVVALSTFGTAAALAARRAVATSTNRAALLRADWAAEGCAQHARATINALLRAEQDRPGGIVERWRTLDAALAGTSVTGGLGAGAGELAGAAPDVGGAPGAGPLCTLRLESAGARADLNALDRESLRLLFQAVDVPTARADELADALVAWRHGHRNGHHGAGEPSSLESQRDEWRVPRALAAVEELRDLPEFDSATVVAVGLAAGVEPGRLDLGHAPAAALATLPGFDPEVVARLVERRRLGEPVSLAALAGDVSPAAARTLAASVGALAGRATAEPDAWVLTITAGDPAGDGTRPAPPADGGDPGGDHASGQRGMRATVELRLARAGWRAAVMRRRSWW